MVVVSLYNLVDTFWVGRLGHEAIAAVTVVMPFFVLCIAVGVGTGVGINALASRKFGERDIPAANRVAGQIYFLSLLLGVIFIIITNVFPRQVLLLSGATPDVMEMGETYLRMLGWGLPFLFFSMSGRNAFQASGDAIRPMVFSLVSQVTNIVLDPVLIFGWWIFPEMGIAGAAIATSISCVVSAVFANYWITSKTSAYHLERHYLLPHLPTIAAIYRVGLPSMLMETTESIIFAMFNHVVAGFGSVALAAVGIASRISDLAFMPIVGTSHGLLPIIGYSLGARLWSRLWGAVRQASLAMMALMSVATILMEIFTPQLVGLFSKDPELIAIAVPGMRIFLSTLVIVGPTIMFITTFQGLSKGKDAMFLSLARQFLFFIPGLYGLTFLMGINGMWISMPISDFAGFAVAGFWLYREYRRQKKDPAWHRTVAGPLNKPGLN
jgi:putative MATE family efflux protein